MQQNTIMRFLLIFVVVLARSVCSLYVMELGEVDPKDDDGIPDVFINRRRFQEVPPPTIVRRVNDPSRVAKVARIYNMLKKQVGLSKLKDLLQQDKNKVLRTSNNNLYGNVMSKKREDDNYLIESELKNALAQKSTALLDNPSVQKKGLNDFLVFKPEVRDPFVTVIPNDIYYNSEKKCVNWLEDCNAQGIRARMLNKVFSPYK